MSEAENPLLEGLRLRRSADPCAIVIFGASGDLTRRKIFPALYSLAFRRLLPERFGIVGVARTEQTTKQWIAEMKKAVKEHGRDELRSEVWNELAAAMRYVATDFADDMGEDSVVEALGDLDEKRGPRATGSTTSPCRRRTSRRSSNKLGSAWGCGRAGRG